MGKVLIAYATRTGETQQIADLIGASPKVPGSILIGLNNRVPQFHDVYRLDLASGKRELVLKNDRWAGFLADWDLNVRFGFRQTPAGGAAIDRIAADGKAEQFDEFGSLLLGQRQGRNAQRSAFGDVGTVGFEHVSSFQSGITCSRRAGDLLWWITFRPCPGRGSCAFSGQS